MVGPEVKPASGIADSNFEFVSSLLWFCRTSESRLAELLHNRGPVPVDRLRGEFATTRSQKIHARLEVVRFVVDVDSATAIAIRFDSPGWSLRSLVPMFTAQALMSRFGLMRRIRVMISQMMPGYPQYNTIIPRTA